MLAHHRLVEDGVVIAGRISGRQACRNAEAAQHQRLGGGELLAVAGLVVEEEPVDRIVTGRHPREVERVSVVRLQVAGQRHDGVERVGGFIGDVCGHARS